MSNLDHRPRCTDVIPDDLTFWLHGPDCPANPTPGRWTCPVCGASTSGAARARRTLRRRCARNHAGTTVPPPVTRPRRRR